MGLFAAPPINSRDPVDMARAAITNLEIYIEQMIDGEERYLAKNDYLLYLVHSLVEDAIKYHRETYDEATISQKKAEAKRNAQEILIKSGLLWPDGSMVEHDEEGERLVPERYKNKEKEWRTPRLDG